MTFEELHKIISPSDPVEDFPENARARALRCLSDLTSSRKKCQNVSRLLRSMGFQDCDWSDIEKVEIAEKLGI